MSTLAGQDLNLWDPKSALLTATGDHSLGTLEHNRSQEVLLLGVGAATKAGVYPNNVRRGLKCQVMGSVLTNIHKTQTERPFPSQGHKRSPGCRGDQSQL